MFLYEYLIKLLMGNSNTIFLGLFVVIFGYCGWLLWQINNNLNEFRRQWENHNKDNKELIHEINDLNKIMYQDFLERLKEIQRNLENHNKLLNETDTETEKFKNEIISSIKEETDEVKETVKLLLGRSISLTRKNNNLKDVINVTEGDNQD